MTMTPERADQKSNSHLLYIPQSSTLYILLSHVFGQIGASPEVSEFALRTTQTRAFILKLHGKQYLPVMMLAKLLAEITPLLHCDGLERTQQLRTMADLLYKALQFLKAIHLNHTLARPFELGPEWGDKVIVADAGLWGSNPSYGAGFGGNTVVTFNSHAIH